MKKHYKIGMLLAALLLAGCVQAPAENIHSDNPTKATYQELDQGTAQENLEANEDILLIDVRTPEEFEEKRIPNSILVPDYDIDKLAPEILPDKDAQIYLYCRSGARSSAAAAKLADMGYTQVYDIGGIIDWKFETISGKE
jgi:rhodanese-related sulfurtransferase